MKLQINMAGSWRDVLSFDPVDLDQIKPHARYLLTLSRGKPSMRITEDDNTALFRLRHPEFEWKSA